MGNIEYQKLRKHIKTGDILLFHSTKPIARIIQNVDNAYYHHSGIAAWFAGRLFIIDAQPEGSGMAFLSRRWKEKKYDDCLILRPQVPVDDALERTLRFVEEYKRYDFSKLVEILLYKKFDVKFERLDSKNEFICSELTQLYGVELGIDKYRFINIFTPQDHVRVKSNLIYDVL